MAIQTQIDITGSMKKTIEEAIQIEIEKEWDDRIDMLNKRKNEIISGILLGIMKEVDIQTISDRVIFTIEEIKK